LARLTRTMPLPEHLPDAESDAPFQLPVGQFGAG
jgi:hypothetical protein